MIRRILWIVAGLLISVPSSGSGQARVTISGRVVDSSTEIGIANAAITIGAKATRTSQSGGFRVTSVDAGTVRITVEALGYRTWSADVNVARDTAMFIALDVQVIALDSITVRAGNVQLRGEVIDAATGLPVVDVDVETDAGRKTKSGNIGRFKVTLPQSVPTTVRLQAFTYLPLGMTIAAARDTSVVFKLAVDSVALRMIDEQVKRLEARSRGQRTAGKPPLSHADLLDNPNLDLYEFLQREGYLRRARCIVLDDRQLLDTGNGMDRLHTILIDRVERVELLYRGEMLRLYTREYVRRMTGGGVKLTPPLYIREVSPPHCS